MRHPIAALLLTISASALAAQSAGSEFDVISIKRNTSGARSASFGATPGFAFNMTNVAMIAAVTFAYPAKNSEVLGDTPDWLLNDRYDVAAKAAGKPSEDEVRMMLRAALKERMKLSAHIEQREIPTYALVIARPGHAGLQRSMIDCDAVNAARAQGVKREAAANGAPQCSYSWSDMIRAGGITMETLATMIGGSDGVAGRVVFNRTGLDGRFEFTLRFAAPASNGLVPDDIPNLFTALQDQLGLRLEPTRAAVDTLVIDHVERPTEN
jgi:uncharacterized protein (TIGR03435 family)